MGSIISLILSTWCFLDVDDGNPDQTRKAMQTIIWYQNIWITLVAVPLFIISKDKPAIPPCLAALAKMPRRENFCATMMLTMKDRSYLMVMICFSIGTGVYMSLSCIIAQVFEPFNYSPVQICILGVLFIGLGIVFALLLGVVLDRTHRFLLMLRCLCFGMFISTFCSLFTFPSQIFPLVSINIGVAGLVLLPIVPVGIAFGVELTFPLPPVMSNGFLLLSGRIVSIIMSYLAAYLANINSEYALILFCVTSFIAAVASLFIKEDLKKQKYIA